MKYRPLGRTGIEVSAIGFGAWAIGGPVDLFGIPVGWGAVQDSDSEAAIRRALELGVNFFDTADVYGSGHSEELIGKCVPAGNIIATKVGNSRAGNRPIKDFSEAHVRRSLEASLKRLKRDFVDLYQLHNPPQSVWESEEVFGVLQRFKREGKIRFSGASISSMEEGSHLIQTGKVDVLQVLFNVLNQEPARKLFPLAKEQGVGIIVRVPLASGQLTGKFDANHQFGRDDNRKNYLSSKRLRESLEKVKKFQEMSADSGFSPAQVALAFVLNHPAVSVAIPGAKRLEQVEENVSAGSVLLSKTLVDSIEKEFSDYNFYLRYGVKV